VKILLTNDDGIHAAGLRAAYRALSELGEVFIVAPDRPRSATGHSITLHKPLRLREVTLADGMTAYETNGVPADCVCLGVHVVMQGTPDLVVSGVNHGPNMGWDVTYSGTVSAAMEGAVAGVPSIAVSVASYDEGIDYGPAVAFTAKLGAWFVEVGGLARGLLNVNVPNCPAERIAGVALTTLGSRRYLATVKQGEDPRGRPYYWIDGDPTEGIEQPGSDVEAIRRNMISVTPIGLDLTHRDGYERLREIESF
jgi:5'-nucleotidase